MNKKMIASIFLGAGLLVSLSGSIGYQLALNTSGVVQEQAIPEGVTSESVNDFLTVYYSFDEYGDNLASYEGYLTDEFQQAENDRVTTEQEANNPQNFGNSLFVSSQNYIRQLNEQEFIVIAEVTHTIDLVNSEHQIVEKGIENHPTLKLTYLYDEESEQFLITTLTTMSLSE